MRIKSEVSVTTTSVCRFVFAGGAAGFAVHQAIGAEADVEHGLAEHAEFFAPATRLNAFALRADDLARRWFRRHAPSLVWSRPGRNVTKVTRVMNYRLSKLRNEHFRVLEPIPPRTITILLRPHQFDAISERVVDIDSVVARKRFIAIQ